MTDHESTVGRVRQWMARAIGGTSVIVLRPEESALVLGPDRSPRAFFIPSGDEDADLDPGASLVGALFVACASEVGRLVSFLDTIEAVRGIGEE